MNDDPVVMYAELLGAVIRFERRKEKIQSTEIASYLGISQSAYSRLETGKSNLNATQLNQICHIIKEQDPLYLMRKTWDAQKKLIKNGVVIQMSNWKVTDRQILQGRAWLQELVQK